MARYFALTIHLYDQRYHGVDEWPPAPARVFQALVAGAARGRHVPDHLAQALTTLEELAPPIIAAPPASRGQRLSVFVPNNDLDAVGGDPDRIGEVRTKKFVWPRLLESAAPFLYAWPLPDGIGDELPALADGLYQLGRGIDPAWARGETLDDAELSARLRAHHGSVHRPTAGEGSRHLAVPAASSFRSVVRRFDAALVRLRPSADGGTTNFVQPPKAHFAMARYDGHPTLHLFELRRESDPARASAWATWRAASLVERVRDLAVDALSRALPDRKSDIDRVLVGRKRDGSNGGPAEQRVRFIPLPSIGHGHADHAIRRVLVQVPPGPFSEADVLWALSGRSLFDPDTGEVGQTTLAAVPSDEMVARYRGPARTWRSVTPVALTAAARRRIEPTRQREEAKSASERGTEERAAGHAVGQALRHAGVDAFLGRVRVQREPFQSHGTRAERFADGTRFPKEALWHVEVEFDRNVPGPLVLGDGRFLGLGLMAPDVKVEDVFAFEITNGLAERADPLLVARALRRAVMSRVQAALGSRARLPGYFSGHAEDGATLRDEPHLFYVADLGRRRVLLVAPHHVDRRRPTRVEREHLLELGSALDGFHALRAGAAGRLTLARGDLSEDDPLLRASRVWRSETAYVVTRHARLDDARAAVRADILRQCVRVTLPAPRVEVSRVEAAGGAGLSARLTLEFERPVRGPILLGRTRFFGGGMFAAAPSSELVQRPVE